MNINLFCYRKGYMFLYDTIYLNCFKCTQEEIKLVCFKTLFLGSIY